MVLSVHQGTTPDTARGRVRRVLRSRSLDSLWAVLFALGCGAILLVVTGHDPVVAYREWIERAILQPRGLQESVVRATPLIFAGSAVLLAMRAGVWNIGIDGQVLVGALAAAVTASYLTPANQVVLWAAALAAGMLAGGLWALVPAILRGRLGINEIVTTIMFNYIGIAATSWLVKGPLGDRDVVSPQTSIIPRELRFSTFGDTRIHVGLAIAIVGVVLLGWFLSRTVAGFELSITGKSPGAARHGHIPVAAYITGALVVSGAIAALAGANDVLSTKGVFQGEWNPAYGFVAFAVVFLGQRRLPGLVLSALVFGQLSYAADVMPRAADVAPAFFSVVEGALLVALAISVWARSSGHAQTRRLRSRMRKTR